MFKSTNLPPRGTSTLRMIPQPSSSDSTAALTNAGKSQNKIEVIPHRFSVCSHCCSILIMQGPHANHLDANYHSVKFRNLLMPTSSSPWNRNPEDIQTHTIKSTAVMRQYMFQTWLLSLSTFLTPDCCFACLLVYVNNSVHASPLVT